jgi:uncharacterized membrane protein
MVQDNRPPGRAGPFILSSIVLLGNLVATALYVLIVFVTPDSAALAGSRIEEAFFIALFCATPLSVGSLIAHIARWRHARMVLLLTVLLGLVSGGYFMILFGGYFIGFLRSFGNS